MTTMLSRDLTTAVLPLKEELSKFLGIRSSEPKITRENHSENVKHIAEGFKKDHILYEIEFKSHGEWIPAYVMRPPFIQMTARGVTPAVVVSHTHGSNWELGSNEVVGKVGSSIEAIGQDLVKRGYFVIAPDMLGFGKRIKISPQEQTEGMQGCVGFSSLLSSLNVSGDNYLRHVIQDTMRAIDVLETFPEVDKSRIGLIGYSFGGHISSKTAIFDERAYATVAFGSIGTIAEKIRSKCKIDPTENVAGLTRLGDTPDFLKLIAPRAMLISNSINDKYAIDSESVYEAIKPTWDDLCASDNLTLMNHYKDEHRLTQEMKEDAYNWLDEKMFK